MSTTNIKNAPNKAAGNVSPATTETVADILDRERDGIIHDWTELVAKDKDLMSIPMSYEDRAGHLPKLLRDLTARLRLKDGPKAPLYHAASHHGDLRREQGYTVAMIVEESRLLQVTLFTTLHKNTNRIEYGRLLPDVVTIADEVDAQLKQQILGYAANALGSTISAA
jgi:hypothetical protein